MPYAILDGLLAEYTVGIIPTDFDIANPVGTGAFAYKSFDPGKTSTFTKYADYWGDPAFVDELQIQDFPDPSAMVNALQAGQIQTVDNLPYNLIDTIKGAGGGVLVSETGAWVPFTMRVDQAPFNDVKVRQAMRLIVDRQQMIDQTLSGYGSLGNDMYAPFDVDYASDLPQREQDIDQAKSLLSEAGQEGLQVELFTGDDIGSVAPAAANLFVEQAKLAGVDVKVTKKTPFYDDQYLQYTFAQDFWNTRNYIPQAVVGTFPPEQGGTYNETHWDNQEHRDLVNAAAQELDATKRGELLHEAQEIEYNEGGLIIWGFRQQRRRLRRQRPGPRAEQVPPARVLQVQQGLGPVGLTDDRLGDGDPRPGSPGGGRTSAGPARRRGLGGVAGSPARPGRADAVAGVDPGVPGDGCPGRPRPGHPRPRLRLQPRPGRGAGGAAEHRRRRWCRATSTGSAAC